MNNCSELTHPAQRYLPCPELFVITTYYNPAGYRTKRQNYERFAHPLREAGIHLLTVECAFGDEPFELAPSAQVIQVRGHDVMWMKERLINLAVARLPPQATKIAWLDADLLFSNPAWAQETAALLERFPIVQPYTRVGLLEPHQSLFAGRGFPSFAYQQHPRRLWALHDAGLPGSPGLAWAARRALVQRHGLYDAAIIGGGDLLFAHASSGRISSPGIRAVTGAEAPKTPGSSSRLLRRVMRWLSRVPRPHWLIDRDIAKAQAALPPVTPSETFNIHYQRWATHWYADVHGQIGYTPGIVLHLWHGTPARRQYTARFAIPTRHRYAPASDLRLNQDGIWEWASDKTGLHQAVREYFWSRQEDEVTTRDSA